MSIEKEMADAIYIKDVAAVDKLLSDGFDPNTLLSDGEYLEMFGSTTPLILACRMGDLNTVSSLIDNGADVNFRDDNSTCAIIVSPDLFELVDASDEQAHEIVNLLIERGADVNAENNYGETALFNHAKSHSPTPSIKPLVLGALIKAGADVDAKNKDSESVFDQLWDYHQNDYGMIVDELRILAPESSNISFKNFYDFVWAIEDRDLDKIESLIISGIDLNQRLPWYKGNEDANYESVVYSQQDVKLNVAVLDLFRKHHIEHEYLEREIAFNFLSALEKRDVSTIEYLIETGIDLNYMHEDIGVTEKDEYALYRQMSDKFSSQEEGVVLSAMSKKNIDPTKINGFDLTSIVQVITSNNIENIKYFEKYGVDIISTALDKEYFHGEGTTLEVSIIQDSLDSAKYIISKNPDMISDFTNAEAIERIILNSDLDPACCIQKKLESFPLIISEFTNTQAIQKVFDEGMVNLSNKELDQVKSAYEDNSVKGGVAIIERHKLQQSRLKPLLDKYEKADRIKAELENDKERDQGIGL